MHGYLAASVAAVPMGAFRDSAFSGGTTGVWRLQEVGEGFQCSVGNVMLDALGVGFGNFGGDAECDKEVHDQPVAGAHPFGQRLSRIRQKHSAIREPCCESLALQSSDRLDRGRMGDAQTASNIGRPGLPTGRQQIRNELAWVSSGGSPAMVRLSLALRNIRPLEPTGGSSCAGLAIFAIHVST